MRGQWPILCYKGKRARSFFLWSFDYPCLVLNRSFSKNEVQ